MKKLLKLIALPLVLISTVLFTSCGEDTGLLSGGEDLTNGELIVNSTTIRPELNLTANANSTVNITVKFLEAENKMKRLYITKNVYGSEDGVIPYEITTVVSDVKTYGDGSINLGSKEGQEFTYQIPFETPQDLDGVVVYKLWTTYNTAITSKGDFRDVTKRNAYGTDETTAAFGTITIKAGAGTATQLDIKEFSSVILAAPTQDGRSKSFISMFNGKIYTIKEGKEAASFWDFGYFYGVTKKASFASAANFPTDIVNIPVISGIDTSKEPLNNFYIAKSVKDFDSATSTEIENITKPSTERVTNLTVGTVLEFQDKDGAKGLIKITKIENTNGVNGKIYFDVKMQNFDYLKF